MGFLLAFFGAFLVIGGLTDEPFDTQHQWGVAVGAVLTVVGAILYVIGGGDDL